MEEENRIREVSTVKVIKNSRGYNWEIKVVAGESRETLDQMRLNAVDQCHKLNKEMGELI